MAASLGQHVHVQGTSAAASFTTPSMTSAASGSVFVQWWNVFGSISGVQDSKSNTYTQIQSTVTAPSTVKTALWYKENGTGGSSHTATINVTGGGSLAQGGLVEFLGCVTSSAKDQDVAGINDTSSPFTTNTTGTTSQADEIAFACYGTDTPSGTETITWGNGFTQIDADGNSSFVTGGAGYKVLSSTGTVQGSITSSTATAAVGFVVTFKAATGGGGDVTVGLTGVSGTSAVGTVGVSHDQALTGVAGTSAVGTVVPNTSKALTGNAGTSAVGSVTPSTAVALTGVAGTAAAGNVSTGSDVVVGLTGVGATAAVGTLAPSTSVALTGNAGTGQIGTLAPDHAQALTGNAGTTAVGSVSPSTAVALTGNQATAQVGNVGVQGDVTVALTGVQATAQVGSLFVDTAVDVPRRGGGTSKKLGKRPPYWWEIGVKKKKEDEEVPMLPEVVIPDSVPIDWEYIPRVRFAATPALPDREKRKQRVRNIISILDQLDD